MHKKQLLDKINQTQHFIRTLRRERREELRPYLNKLQHLKEKAFFNKPSIDLTDAQELELTKTMRSIIEIVKTFKKRPQPQK